MNKQLKKIEDETTALQAPVSGNWGVADIFEPEDLVLPRLILMQANSKPAQQRKLNSVGEKIVAGDVLSVPAMRKVADLETGLKVIMFYADRRMLLVEKSNGRIRRNERLTQETKKLDRQLTRVDGTECEYGIAYQLFCLLPGNDISVQLPHVWLFKKGELHTAKRLMSDFKILAAQNIPSAAKVIEFVVETVDRNGNTWLSLNYKESRNSTVAEVAAAKYWHELITSSNVVVESDETEEVHTKLEDNPRQAFPESDTSYEF